MALPARTRVVFFLQGERVPAARFRGVAISQALARAGVVCELRVCRPSVYGDTNLPGPIRRLRPLFYPAAVACRLRQLTDLRPTDIVFFQRPMIELPTVLLERIAAHGRRSVFDFDDAIYLNRGGAAKLRKLVALCDRVIAGNRTLAGEAASPDKTRIIPTAVDADRFGFQAARATANADVVVGWTGTHGNYVQLATAAEGIRRALKRTGARFLIIADRPPPGFLAPLKPDYVRWDGEREVDDLARIDIGVMPLPDQPYAQGKCAFKLIQYMALGRPGVASPVGANRDVIADGENGFLAQSDDEWDERLTALIRDPVLRARMGNNARATVERTYAVAAVLPHYLNLLRELVDSPAGNG